MLIRLTAGGGPILLNTDHIIMVEPLKDGGSTITVTGEKNFLTVQQSINDVEIAADSMFEDLVHCRVCGCTDVAACEDEATGMPCHWAAPGLCSRCARLQEEQR